MADIVAPFGAHLSNEPHAEVIAFLEDILAQAKRGEVHGIAACYIVGRGKMITDWEGGRASEIQMLAAAARLLHRINMAADED